MTPLHYTAKVLPDGHLPLPREFEARAGEEVDVIVAHLSPPNGDPEVRADHLLQHWAGIGRGSGTGVAARHDDLLFGL